MQKHGIAGGLIVLAVLPALGLLASVGRTPGFISDSVQYAAAADSLQHGLGLSTPLAPDFDAQFDPNGQLVARHRLTVWPPGYPLAIALASRFLGLPTAQAALTVNATALTVMLVFVFLTVRRAANDQVAAAVTAVTGVLPPIQGVARMILSEPLFLAASAVCVFALDSWMRRPERIRYSWCAALAVGAAMHLRFTGVFLATLHAVVAHLVTRRTKERFPAVASVAAGLLFGCAFIVYRLIWWGCAACTYRPPSTQTLTDNAVAFALAVLRWLPAVYDFTVGPLDTALSLMALVLLALYSTRSSRSRALRWPYTTVVPFLFVGIYVLSLVVTRTLVEFDALGTRLAVPVSLGLDLIALVWIFARLPQRAGLVAAAGLVVVFVASGVVSNRRPEWRVLSNRTSADSPIVRYAAGHVREHPDVPIYAREASLLSAQVDLQAPIYWLPHHGIPRLRPGEQGVVLLRPPLPADTAGLLDVDGKRIVDESELVVWELRGPSGRGALPSR